MLQFLIRGGGRRRRRRRREIHNPAGFKRAQLGPESCRIWDAEDRAAGGLHPPGHLCFKPASDFVFF